MKPIKRHLAQCFCGAVLLELTNEPEVMAYCHCESCRQWSAADANPFTLWQPDNFRIVKGSQFVRGYDRIRAKGEPVTADTFTSERCWCSQCGGHLFSRHPSVDLVDIPAPLLQNFDFKPAFHANYITAVRPVMDGLPKFVDFPAEAGGSGQTLPEAIAQAS